MSHGWKGKGEMVAAHNFRECDHSNKWLTVLICGNWGVNSRFTHTYVDEDQMLVLKGQVGLSWLVFPENEFCQAGARNLVTRESLFTRVDDAGKSWSLHGFGTKPWPGESLMLSDAMGFAEKWTEKKWKKTLMIFAEQITKFWMIFFDGQTPASGGD